MDGWDARMHGHTIKNPTLMFIHTDMETRIQRRTEAQEARRAQRREKRILLRDKKGKGEPQQEDDEDTRDMAALMGFSSFASTLS